MATLVTGGTGLIGAKVVARLVEAGESNVVAMDIRPRPERLGGHADRVTIRIGDVGDPAQVTRAIADVQPETIYHLGGMLSAPSEEDHGAALRRQRARDLPRAEGGPASSGAQGVIHKHGRDLRL